MKGHAGKTKIGILLLALIVALGSMGVAFAAWTDTITIQGTITTADIDWELTVVDFTWECEPREETAWASGIAYEGPGGGWASYFTYTIGSDEIYVDLIAAQTELVGEVTVSTVGGNLVVHYDQMVGSWTIIDTHLYAGAVKPPNFHPGQFPYHEGPFDPTATDVSYTIPLGELGDLVDDTVYIAAQAVVTDGSTDCGGQTWPTGDHSIVVTLTDVPAGSSGQLCFNILNSGTIPIRISDIGSSVFPADPPDPPGVTVGLPLDIIGTQLHPGESLPAPVCVSIVVTASGTYTVTITVYAVQWNMY